MTAFLRRHSRLLPLCALPAISLIAYLNALSNGFHLDDYHGIVRNPTIRSLRNIPSYFTDPSTLTLSHLADWRPVLQVTYALNYALGGLNPTGFLLSNVLVHTGAAISLFLVVTQMAGASPIRLPFESRRLMPWSALAPAALFAVHPVNAEAVNYVWARSSLLAAFFFVFACYCFLRGPLSGRSEGGIFWHLGGLASFALGLSSKGTAITLPAVLVLYELLFLSAGSRNPLRLFRDEPWRLKKYVPLAALFLAYLVLRGILLPWTFWTFTRPTAPREIPATTYLLTQFRAWVYYIRLFLWPDPLIFDFPGFGWSDSLWDHRVLLSLGVVATILALAWRVRRTEPLITFFTGWFFLALIPEASFLPLSPPVNGHRPYLAYAGLSVVFTLLSLKGGSWIWRKLTGGAEARAPGFWLTYGLVLGIILSTLTATTLRRNQVWRDEVTLWSDVVRTDPTNPRAYMSLGVQLLDQGNRGRAHEMFEKAVEVAPRNYYAYVLRGHSNLLLDRDEEALSDFNEAVRLLPRSPYGFFYRGELYRKTAQYDKALADYRSALELKTAYTDAYVGIAMVHMERRDIAEATEACRKIIDIDRDDPRGPGCLEALRGAAPLP